MKTELLLKNRKAFHNYEVIDSYEAGIALVGSEVKSLRLKQCNFADSYARIINGELWLIGLHISPYKQGSHFNHEALRNRKLLLHRREIAKLHKKIEEKGLTLVPLSLILKGSLIKLSLGLCRGRRQHDKRAYIKERDIDRQVQSELY